MIAIRSWIDRALGRRWLGMAVLVLLAILLVFIALHSLSDAVIESALVVCATIALLVVVTGSLASRPGQLVALLPLTRAPPAPVSTITLFASAFAKRSASVRR